MRLPTACLLALLMSSARASATPLEAESPPRLDRLSEALAALDGPWRAAAASADDGHGLAPALSGPLAGAVLELEACHCVRDRRAAAAGLAATVLGAARSAGAGAAELAALEVQLREHLPGLVPAHGPRGADEAGGVAASGAGGLLGAGEGSSRTELRLLLRELRPGLTARLSDEAVDGLLVALMRDADARSLPPRVAERLDAELLPGRPEARR